MVAIVSQNTTASELTAEQITRLVFVGGTVPGSPINQLARNVIQSTGLVELSPSFTLVDSVMPPILQPIYLCRFAPAKDLITNNASYCPAGSNPNPLPVAPASPSYARSGLLLNAVFNLAKNDVDDPSKRILLLNQVG